MIALYISILAILVGFFVITKHKKSNQSTQSICSICDQVFNEDDILSIDNMPFCGPHAKVYFETEWTLVQEVVCTPDMAEESVKLYEKKLSDYQKGILGFIKSDYEVVNDQIQTKLSYYIQK